MKWREYDYCPSRGVLIAMAISFLFWLFFCGGAALIVKAVTP